MALGAARLFVLYVWCVGSGSLFFCKYIFNNNRFHLQKNNVPDVCGHTYNTKSMTEKNGGTGLPGLRWPKRWRVGNQLLFFTRQGKGFISWDDVVAIRFVNHPGYCIGNVPLNSHTYARPCTEPVANYFSVTIPLLHCCGFVWHLSLLD